MLLKSNIATIIGLLLSHFVLLGAAALLRDITGLSVHFVLLYGIYCLPPLLVLFKLKLARERADHESKKRKNIWNTMLDVEILIAGTVILLLIA
ncbi:MAG: hypothetical protein IKE65_01760, partial [Clostridia bacterium]|nr:hypothetical protein [Clostridia bacterium]